MKRFDFIRTLGVLPAAFLLPRFLRKKKRELTETDLPIRSGVNEMKSGTIFSTFKAKCPYCGGKAMADLMVLTSPADSRCKSITSLVWCLDNKCGAFGFGARGESEGGNSKW